MDAQYRSLNRLLDGILRVGQKLTIPKLILFDAAVNFYPAFYLIRGVILTKKFMFIFIVFSLLGLSACNNDNKDQKKPSVSSHQTNRNVDKTRKSHYETMAQIRAEMINKYQKQIPKQWGENVTGVKTRLATQEKVIALTFDACGGKRGSGYDKKLIDFLEKQKVSATLFINSRWIDSNKETFLSLAKNPLFEIENHGLLHRPLSVTGKSVWGIKGTANANEVVSEVLESAEKIKKLTGRKPKFFRSGTAYYDDVAVKIVNDLGEQPVNFNVLGDAGATYSAAQVKSALLSAKPGSIVICHMNQPIGETAEGVIQAIPLLKRNGYRFVKLEDYNLK